MMCGCERTLQEGLAVYVCFDVRKNFTTMLGLCTPLYIFLNLPRISKHPRIHNTSEKHMDMSGELPEHFLNISGKCPEKIREISGIVLEHFWELSGKCPREISQCPGGNFQDMSGKCPGNCPEKIRKISGMCS